MTLPRNALEARGAELLVTGFLLAEGVEAYVAYENQEAHDVVALAPVRAGSTLPARPAVTLQVKSKVVGAGKASSLEWFIGHTGARISADFLVLVRNNGAPAPKRRLDFWDLPKAVLVPGYRDYKSTTNLALPAVEEREQYRDAWQIVAAEAHKPPIVKLSQA